MKFGTPAGTQIHVLNSTTLTAVTPAHAAVNVAVVVYSAYGHSSTAHTYLYVKPPPPRPTKTSPPSSAPASTQAGSPAPSSSR